MTLDRGGDRLQRALWGVVAFLVVAAYVPLMSLAALAYGESGNPPVCNYPCTHNYSSPLWELVLAPPVLLLASVVLALVPASRRWAYYALLGAAAIAIATLAATYLDPHFFDFSYAT